MSTVAVTGAAGYRASWVGDPKKTEHLLALDGAKERLKLIKANLLEEGSFDVVVDGCDVAFNGKPRTPDVVVDETWWSNVDFCRENKMWYVLSKTLAEEAAWKFAKENGIDMVSINPSMVIGPLLQPTLNTSSAAILNLINGAETFPNATFGWVNVKDVAYAHIFAYENSSANGRYLLVDRTAHHSEIVNILRELYPTLKLPEKCADDKPYAPTYNVSNERAKSIGVEFTSLKQSIKETVESLKEKNLFKA
ncbi:hypothetical protein RD792_003190 [Penstemon davidsonii]|uniref:NAD-dependent epimerase/dehydratase domain-containing protein n=1 Tax=Penstemon davidsonii TaxID=160366 RepID=A0ABR0DU04_9LAMI|nr:hypothetical protein RD792_003190 [Penstemon davidsonii]